MKNSELIKMLQGYPQDAEVWVEGDNGVKCELEVLTAYEKAVVGTRNITLSPDEKLISFPSKAEDTEGLQFNDARAKRPKHLQRCLCYNKYWHSVMCYVYDDISKYWCTQATDEHDPDGGNHVSDYADFTITHWVGVDKLNEQFL